MLTCTTISSLAHVSTSIEYASECRCSSELKFQAPSLGSGCPGTQLGPSIWDCGRTCACPLQVFLSGSTTPCTPPESRGHATSTAVLRASGLQHQCGCVGCPATPRVRTGWRQPSPQIPVHPRGRWFPRSYPHPRHCRVPAPKLHQLPSGPPAPARWHIYISSAHLHLFTYFRGKLLGFMTPDQLPRGYH